MKLTILGSGCSWPDPNRAAPAFAVQHNNRAFLVDCGQGADRNLVKQGIALDSVEAVFLTHFHTDHVSGLIPLLFAYYVHFPKRGPLSIYGPEGLNEYIEAQKNAQADWLGRMPFPVTIQPLKQLEIVQPIPDVKVRGYEVEHKKTSFGYRCESEEGAIAFSGDSAICDSLVELAKGADLFVCEIGKPDDHPVEGHLQYSQLPGLFEKADAKRIILVHFDEYFDEEKFLGMMAGLDRDRILLGQDQKVYRLGV